MIRNENKWKNSYSFLKNCTPKALLTLRRGVLFLLPATMKLSGLLLQRRRANLLWNASAMESLSGGSLSFPITVSMIVFSALLGFVLSFVEKLFHSRSNRLTLMITFVFLTVALAKLHFTVGVVNIHFSSLLTCMMLGTVFCNVCKTSEEMMERTERWTKPLFLLFFVISGASLDLSVFSKPIFVLIGLIYILARSAGKYLGATGSAKLMKCDENIVKYLGITLLPQAGVALGMVSTVASDEVFGQTEIGNTVRFVILFGVLIYEIFGPMMTRWALTRAGDIQSKPEGLSARRENAN